MIRLATTERAYPWGVLRSTNASKIKFALVEKGLPFEVDRVQPGDLWKKPAEMRVVHPLAKVPWIVDDGLGVFDSTVILEYLEDRYPTPALLPGAVAARADVRMVETFADEALLTGVLAGIWMPLWQSPERRDASAQDAARGELRNSVLPWLEARLEDGREWMCGDFSLADVALAPCAMVLEVDATDLTVVPHFAAYLDRLRARPAYRLISPQTTLADSERFG